MSIDIVRKMFDEDDIDAFDEVVDSGDWIDDGKYSFREDVVKYDGKFYKISQSRSGSYYTDYDYMDPEIEEVEKREKTVVQTYWVTVK